MKKYLKILSVGFSIIILTSFMRNNEEKYIRYPEEIGISQTCSGQEVEISIEITSESATKIKVHSFSLDKGNFTIFKNNKSLKMTEILHLTKRNPIILKVKYKILDSDKPTTFNFKTNLSKYSDNKIKLSYGQHFITAKDIRKGKEQIVNITESCQDSINVFFPYGGTVSSATLFNNSSEERKVLKSVSYMLGDHNYFTFSKKESGRYYVRFGSCHWGNNFWLTVKLIPKSKEPEETDSTRMIMDNMRISIDKLNNRRNKGLMIP